jgi:hypothetical protein
MKQSFRKPMLTLAGTCLAILSVQAQNRLSFSPASSTSGHTALGLVPRKLSVSAIFLQVCTLINGALGIC